jgi:energy-coupling factor transporter ATP-binding protein EcfA2
MFFSSWNALFPQARIVIFAGHYGSGKSEISVQYARLMAQAGHRVLLADMDIVNPFFRSLDARALLEGEGVQVVAPLFANTNVDVPALVPEITSALHRADMLVVLDVGGDGDGARVLGRYHRDIPEAELAMVFVFNASRPMTRTAKAAALQMEEIEAASRQRFTHVINNTHLLEETNFLLVREGEREAAALAGLRGCPLAGTVVATQLEQTGQEMFDPDTREGRHSIPLLPLVRTLGTHFGDA